jgi:hypothetical protein
MPVLVNHKVKPKQFKAVWQCEESQLIADSLQALPCIHSPDNGHQSKLRGHSPCDVVDNTGKWTTETYITYEPMHLMCDLLYALFRGTRIHALLLQCLKEHDGTAYISQLYRHCYNLRYTSYKSSAHWHGN